MSRPSTIYTSKGMKTSLRPILEPGTIKESTPFSRFDGEKISFKYKVYHYRINNKAYIEDLEESSKTNPPPLDFGDTTLFFKKDGEWIMQEFFSECWWKFLDSALPNYSFTTPYLLSKALDEYSGVTKDSSLNNDAGEELYPHGSIVEELGIFYKVHHFKEENPEIKYDLKYNGLRPINGHRYYEENGNFYFQKLFKLNNKGQTELSCAPPKDELADLFLEKIDWNLEQTIHKDKETVQQIRREVGV